MTYRWARAQNDRYFFLGFFLLVLLLLSLLCDMERREEYVLRNVMWCNCKYDNSVMPYHYREYYCFLLLLTVLNAHLTCKSILFSVASHHLCVCIFTKEKNGMHMKKHVILFYLYHYVDYIKWSRGEKREHHVASNQRV